MVYVALLRGINVGGKNIIKMSELKQTFESLGFSDVKTYINSGNVVFKAPASDDLTEKIEQAIKRDFGLDIPVLLRDLPAIDRLVAALPNTWVNDADTKCDIMFLWDSADDPKIVEQIPHDPSIEDLVYFPGAVVWRTDRANVPRSKVVRVIVGPLYKQLTIRNPNTVRKLYGLMQEANRKTAD